MKRSAPADASAAGAPAAKKQATLAAMFRPASAPTASTTTTSAPASSPPLLPHPLARHWADFPLGGPCGSGLGVVATPPPFIPRAGAPSALALRPGEWVDVRTHPALSATSFVELAGRRVARDALPTAAAAAAAAGAAPPGNELSLFGAREQRVRALASMTPASLGACCFAYFEPPSGAAVGASAVAPAMAASAAAAAAAAAAATAVASPGAPSLPAATARVAAVDMDGTLITPTDPKARFCARADDWRPVYPAALTRAAALAKAGYELVVMTNQAGVAKGHTSLAVVQARCSAVAGALGVPVTFLVAPGGTDFYRKPSPGMWWLWEAVVWPALQARRRAAAQLQPPDAVAGGGGGRGTMPPPIISPPLALLLLPESVYLGDAAGRPKPDKTSPSPRKARDHSAGDLAFALGCGVRFATPEAVFAASQALDDRAPLGGGGGGGGGGVGGGGGPFGEWLACRDLPPPWLQVAVVCDADEAGGGGSSSSQQPQSACASPPPPPAWLAAATAATSSSSFSSAAAAAAGAGPPRPEIVLLIGPPGTGKSTFAAHAFPLEAAAAAAPAAASTSLASYPSPQRLYVRVNQDRLGSRDKAMAAAAAAVQRGCSVVVDATNVEASIRREWVGLGARLGAGGGSGSGSGGGAPVPVRAVVCAGGKPLSFHLVALRTVSPLGGIDGPADRRAVPDMVVHMLHNKLTVPAPAGAGAGAAAAGVGAGAAHEGLARVDTLPFTPGPFLVDTRALAALEAAGAGPAEGARDSGGDGGAGAAADAPAAPLLRRFLTAAAHQAACPATLEHGHLSLYAEALALQLTYACLVT